MKKEEKERLHQDDRFVKLMSSIWEKVTARRQRTAVLLVVIVGAAIAIAVTAGVREELGDKERSTIDKAQTIEEMEKAAAEYPNDAGLLLRLGAAYAERGEAGDREKAAAALERAVAHADRPFDKALSELALGKVEMDLEKYEEAGKLFDSAAANKETQVLIKNEANWYAGRCFELLGRADEAAERYSRITSPRGAADFWQLLAGYRQTMLRQETLD